MAETVNATQDVYVDADGPSDNFEGMALFVYGSGARMYALIDFGNLSAFSGEEIEEAVIKLHIAENNLSSDTTIEFYRISQSWDASEVTYNSRPSVSSSNSKSKTLEDTDIGWETFNITELVQDIVSYGGYGVRVEIEANRLVEFESIENGGHAAKLEITVKTVSGEAPVVNSITWSPKGSTSYVGVGATYYGRHGTALKVTRVSAGTISARVGTVTHTLARGETFTLDEESYTLLHVLSDGECSAAVIAKNESSNQHPTLGENVAFSVDLTWNDDGASATSRRVEWFYLKPSSETYSLAYSNDINNWTHFATGTIVNHVFNDDDVIYIKVIARNKANLTDEYGVGTCGIGQFNLWAGGDGLGGMRTGLSAISFQLSAISGQVPASAGHFFCCNMTKCQ